MTQFSSLWNRLLTQELGSEDSTRLFTDARRQAAINEGIAEFADLTECFVRVSSIVWPGGTMEVNLNNVSDFTRLAAKQSVEFQYTDASSNVTYLSGDDLPQVDVAWLNKHNPSWRSSTVASSVQQLPQYFYVRPDGPSLFMGFWPCPSTGSSASMKALIPYVAKPPVINSTADTEEPYTLSSAVRLDLRPYHKATVHYAASQLEKLRRDYQASDSQLQKFLAWVTRYTQGKRQKGGMVISYVRNYFQPTSDVSDPRT